MTMKPISDDIDVQAERKALQEQIRAALAQQVQSLTDRMIEEEALFRFRTGPNYNGDRRKFVNGAKWARDRMAQHAQPLTDEQRKALRISAREGYMNNDDIVVPT